MHDPITEKVYFQVTVQATEHDDHWVARTLETTIFAHGASRQEAERSAGDANELIVREIKLQGMTALVRFMEKYGIEYSIGEHATPARAGAGRMKRAA